MKILIVEDEARLAQALRQIMLEQQYQADTVANGEDGLEYARSGQYDVIILDVMLPKLSGFEISRRLREMKVSTPIIMLTARDETDDKVNGLDSGADDYMTKPFAAAELLARIRALARRPGEVIHESLGFADLELDLSTNTLACGAKTMHLSYKEFEIMRILMRAQDTIITKETLIIKVWGSDSVAEDNNVEAYISFLRRKFQYLGSRAGIETIRKVGYRLSDKG